MQMIEVTKQLNIDMQKNYQQVLNELCQSCNYMAHAREVAIVQNDREKIAETSQTLLMLTFATVAISYRTAAYQRSAENETFAKKFWAALPSN